MLEHGFAPSVLIVLVKQIYTTGGGLFQHIFFGTFNSQVDYIDGYNVWCVKNIDMDIYIEQYINSNTFDDHKFFGLNIQDDELYDLWEEIKSNIILHHNVIHEPLNIFMGKWFYKSFKLRSIEWLLNRSHSWQF